jgi:hypothetical protein
MADDAPLDEQLARTAEDLRALAESIGAVPPGSAANTISPRTARIILAAVVVVSGLACYWLWTRGHSVLVTLASVLWIFESGRRWRKRRGGNPSRSGRS